jgi:hypothetical protein
MIGRAGSLGRNYSVPEVGGPGRRGNSGTSVIFPREQLAVPAGGLLVPHLLGQRLTVAITLC